MYRTVSVGSDPSGTFLSPGSDGGSMTYRTLNVPSPMSQATGYATAGLDAVYLQNYGVQRGSASSVDEAEIVYRHVEVDNGKAPSVFSQTSSPAKSPEPIPQEVEVVNTSSVSVQEESVVEESVVESVVQKFSRVEVRAELPEPEPAPKLDTRYFGELLAEVYRKNCDIHSCISEHVAKIRGRKHLLDPTIDYKVERLEVEALIPKGLSELTKQQIRYLLQTRLTADKTMRLLLTTFSSLREELLHMRDNLHRIESEKEELERDLSFKSDQAVQYDRLVESLRESNRLIQVQHMVEVASSLECL
ncbi:uncharacterized protein LOC116221575 [Clupea harengus]|uniref:Uncharacterized protein LOC116221575 n=1 Tax=Clupea harengus TaxID=7950 RepID=A0A8M1KS19_CLUHA|nr:uncharacterized protein LOC116221575 [Clupea harengus]